MVWLDVVTGYLAALLGAVGRVLTLDADALAQVAEFGWSVPVGVAVLAGMSIMIGQSIVLAINRVGRRRGVLTMVASGVGTLATGGLETLMVALLGRAILGNSPALGDLLPSVLIAFAPFWLGFLVLLPYSGPGVARGLQVWHLLALWTVLTPVLGADRGDALLVAGAAWLTTTGLGVLVDGSPLRLRERAFRLVSGSRGLTGRDVMASSPLEVDR